MGAELLQIALPTIANVPDSELSEWITTNQLGELASIDPRNARAAAAKCLVGKMWHGCILNVKRNGRDLLVHGPSLPDDLRGIWARRYKSGKALAIPAADPIPAPSTYDARIAKDFAEWRWKVELLSPALAHPKRSHARGAELRKIAGKDCPGPNGKLISPSLTTLRTWLSELEEKKARKHRKQNSPRVIVNRAWDAACPLSDEQKAKIREELDTHLATCWAKGVPGVNRVIQFASSKLVELSREQGWGDANLKNCNIGRYLAEQYREYSLVALKERNAKAFFDQRTPRIKVNRKRLKPGDVVVGDVHPFDVGKDEAGRIVHARLICWLDLATYDIFVTVAILAPGRGIRQEDIAASFADMVQAWGLPKQLRLDNGKEYKWEAMMQGFTALAALVHDYGQVFLPAILGDGDKDELLKGFTPRNVISRARPYNAPAKQIESVQGILEYYFFSMMRGWVGGDRMNKRTHKVGEAPKAHDGTDDEFLRDIETCIKLYQNTEQDPDGKSPFDRRREAYEAGHVPVRVDLAVLIYAFSETGKRMVHNDGVEVSGRWGMIDELIPHIGHKVDIVFAKWHTAHAFYRDTAGKMYAIPMGGEYDHDTPAGAKEQSRRTSVQNAFIRTLKEKTTGMDLMVEAERHLTHMPPPPELPEGIRITTADGAAIATALEEAKDTPPRKLKAGENIHPNSGALLTIAPPKENRPDGKPAPGLPAVSPPVAPTKSNQVATRFDPLKNLQPVAKPT